MESKTTNKFPKDLEALFEKNETDFFMVFLKKKLRNVYKKLSEIQELRKKNELTEAQEEKVKSKASVEEKIKEWRSIIDMYLQAKDEEAKLCSPSQIAAFKKISILLLLAKNKGSACETFLDNISQLSGEEDIKSKADAMGDDLAKLFTKEDNQTDAQTELFSVLEEKKGKKK